MDDKDLNEAFEGINKKLNMSFNSEDDEDKELKEDNKETSREIEVLKDLKKDLQEMKEFYNDFKSKVIEVGNEIKFSKVSDIYLVESYFKLISQVVEIRRIINKMEICENG